MPRAAEHFEIKLDLEEQMRKLKQKQIEEKNRKRNENIRIRKLLLKQLISGTSGNELIMQQEVPIKEEKQERDINLVEDLQRDDQVRYEETIKPPIITNIYAVVDNLEDTISIVNTDRQNILEFSSSGVQIKEDEVVNFEESKELSENDKKILGNIQRSRYDNIEESSQFNQAEEGKKKWNEKHEYFPLEVNKTEAYEEVEDYNNASFESEEEINRINSVPHEHIKREEEEKFNVQNRIIVIEFNDIDEDEKKKRFNAFKERRMKQTKPKTKKVVYTIKALEETIKTLSE